MPEPYLGRSLNRLEDERFVRGRGRYVADLAVAALHGVVVRSPHAHARIASIEVEAARRTPGVAGVFTSADLAADEIGPLPCGVTAIAMARPLVVPPCHALARDAGLVAARELTEAPAYNRWAADALDGKVGGALDGGATPVVRWHAGDGPQT